MRHFGFTLERGRDGELTIIPTYSDYKSDTVVDKMESIGRVVLGKKIKNLELFPENFAKFVCKDFHVSGKDSVVIFSDEAHPMIIHMVYASDKALMKHIEGYENVKAVITDDTELYQTMVKLLSDFQDLGNRLLELSDVLCDTVNDALTELADVLKKAMAEAESDAFEEEAITEPYTTDETDDSESTETMDTDTDTTDTDTTDIGTTHVFDDEYTDCDDATDDATDDYTADVSKEDVSELADKLADIQEQLNNLRRFK